MKANNIVSEAYSQIDKYKELVVSDSYRSEFHLMPPVGMLNDPNGLVQFRDVYHVFFQWNPFATEHGIKFWGHYTTKDFIKWELQPVALSPDQWYDKNGCFSGSAVVHKEQIYLFYTGNVKDEEGNRSTYQCLAVSKDGIHFEKKGPVIYLPEGYTPHFRDPKVWKNDNRWFMVLGAQNEQLQGQAVLFYSDNLVDWHFSGPITGSHLNGLGDFGYMWECPDMFELNGHDVLLVSPQGLKQQGIFYNNEFQSGYFVGHFNPETKTFPHGSFEEMDRGFDFYAPQTMLDNNGRRILYAWLGMSDDMQDYNPTKKHHWLHMLTMPRELKWIDGKLHQLPIREMKGLRKNQILNKHVNLAKNIQETIAYDYNLTTELVVDFNKKNKIEIDFQLFDTIGFNFSTATGLFTFERPNFKNGQKESRSCELKSLNKLRIFIDRSSIEMFLNDGEEVFTSRYFIKDAEEHICIQSNLKADIQLQIWNLESFSVTSQF